MCRTMETSASVVRQLVVAHQPADARFKWGLELLQKDGQVLLCVSMHPIIYAVQTILQCVSLLSGQTSRFTPLVLAGWC